MTTKIEAARAALAEMNREERLAVVNSALRLVADSPEPLSIADVILLEIMVGYMVRVAGKPRGPR